MLFAFGTEATMVGSYRYTIFCIQVDKKPLPQSNKLFWGVSFWLLGFGVTVVFNGLKFGLIGGDNGNG